MKEKGLKIKQILKSILLLFLMVLSIYQVTMMWSQELNSGGGMLWWGLDTFNEAPSLDEEIFLLTPNRLGIYLERDEKEFTIIKRTSLYYDNIFKESAQALIGSLRNGELYATDIELEDLFESRSLFYTLHKHISKDVFMSVFDVEEKMLEGVDAVTSFGVVLSNSDDEFAFLYLIDEDESVNVYQIKDERTKRIVSNLNFYIDNIQENEGGNVIYVSSLFEGLEMLNNHILLPTDKNLWTYTKEIYFYKPFWNIDGFIHSALEDYVNGFEPGSKWHIRHDDEVLYGNDEKVLKYSNQGVFSYEVLGENFGESLTLSESFKLATSFIQKDQEISKQEYYLKNYVKTEEGYIFYYGYSYNDFPLIIDSEFAEGLSVSEPMVIEVKGNDVVMYKRVLINMEEVNPEIKAYNSDYYKVLLDFITENTLEKPIDNMFLGYYWAEDGEAKMRWIIDYNDVYYSLGM